MIASLRRAASRSTEARCCSVMSVIETATPSTLPMESSSRYSECAQVWSASGSAGVRPTSVASIIGTPVSSTRRAAASRDSVSSIGSTSRSVRPTCPAAGTPFILSRAGLTEANRRSVSRTA